MIMIKENAAGMSIIVRTVTRLFVGFIILYGIYVFVNEEQIPGGAFAGGLIIALAFICIMLAYGKDMAMAKVPHAMMIFLGSLGVFLLLGISLMIFTAAFFASDLFGRGGFGYCGVGSVPLAWAASAVKVSAGISAIVIAVVLLRAGREPKS
jgi:multicomponent Na+:H+ antiporter subunit B